MLENSFDYVPNAEGTYFAESITLDGNCVNPNRTPVSLSINERPEDGPEFFEICPGEIVILASENEGLSYLWSTGETSQEIEVSQSGIYTVEQTTENGCTSTKTFEIQVLESAQIDNIFTDDTDIVVELANQGDFMFSLDGFTFQTSPIFQEVAGGRYQILVKSSECGVQSFPFLHIVIPKFFTPNEDGFNDVFRIGGDTYFTEFSVQIFDRFGKLLVTAERAPFTWNGNFNGKPLPSNDYWYRININGKVTTGNVTIKR